LTEAQRSLAERYLPLARALAKPFKLTYPHESDEFESSACMALVEAAQAFDPAKKIKFGTFALYRITGELRQTQRRLVPHGWEDDIANAPHRTSLDESHEECGRVLFCHADPPLSETVEDPIEAVESWLRLLPGQHCKALRQIYVHGLTMKGTAEVIGRALSRVGYLHSESLAMLKECVEARTRRPPRTQKSACDPTDAEDPAGVPESCSS
jgi:RNA polymerase sigma factor (sigma-70 family)